MKRSRCTDRVVLVLHRPEHPRQLGTAENHLSARRNQSPTPTTEQLTDTHDRRNRDLHPIRMGFMLDVTGYGGRSTRAKKRVQERLAALIRRMLDELNVPLTETDRQGTGDGILLFLPQDLDVQRALPVLLRSTAIHLASDNKDFQDQLRLRMAVDIGPVGVAPLGFVGATATNLGRLLDSGPLREWLPAHPSNDLAVIVSDRLHSFVVAEDVPWLPQTQFRRVSVQVKEFSSLSWLWAVDDPAHT